MKKSTCLKITLIVFLMIIAISTLSLAATLSKVTNLTVNLSSGKDAYLKWDSVSNSSGNEIYVNFTSKW